MKMVKDWESVKEETGNENDGSNNPIASSEGSASDSPPHKRASHDDPPKRVVMDISKLPIEEYIALSLPLLQKVPETKMDGPEQFREFAEVALADYKQKTGLDYEFLYERSMSPYRFPCGYKGTHMNFFARLNGCESNPERCFYAELDHRVNKVHNCCILPSKKRGPGEPLVKEFIRHPDHVECKGCSSGNYGLGHWQLGFTEGTSLYNC